MSGIENSSKSESHGFDKSKFSKEKGVFVHDKWLADSTTQKQDNAKVFVEHLDARAENVGRSISVVDVPETEILGSSYSEEDRDWGSERIGDANDEPSSDESNYSEFIDLQERSTIVEKYEKGPGQDVEPWENPDFELYKITDRYGFVHKNCAMMSRADADEKKRIEKEASRERKWLRMIGDWTAGKAVPKLSERIWKGIPEKLRVVIWVKLLDVAQIQRQSKGMIYQELLMRARLVSKDVKQIDLDINRTYRDHMAFRRRYDIKQRSLFNVLAAYAMYNTEVGYCQGMSQIAALFLMYMDEEEAFWCLHALLTGKRHAMHGFFVPGFPKLLRFQAHFEKVLQRYLPRLNRHLEKSGIPPIYLTKWWFGCFLDRVPFPLALRIWDVFLLEGDGILIAMAYNIMKMHRSTIKQLQMESFMEYVQTTLARDFRFSDEETMQSLQECLRKLQNDGMVVPHPPDANDPPELPTKPLGPILTRSMIDIRCDIAEIQSRASRANSVAGRSPGTFLRCRVPPSPTPIRNRLLNLSLPLRHEMSNISSSSHSSNNTVTEKTSNVPSTRAGLSVSHLSSSSERPLITPQKADTSAQMNSVVVERGIWGSTSDSTPSHGALSTSQISMSNIATSSYSRRNPICKEVAEVDINRTYPINRPVPLSRSFRDYFKVEGHLSQSENIGTDPQLYSKAPLEPPIDYDVERHTEAKFPLDTSTLFQGNNAASDGFTVRVATNSSEEHNTCIGEIVHRESFYDNVPPSSASFYPAGPVVKDSQITPSIPFIKATDLFFERRGQGDISDWQFGRVQDRFKRPRDISQLETRVTHLPNNVTCIDVNDVDDRRIVPNRPFSPGQIIAHQFVDRNPCPSDLHSRFVDHGRFSGHSSSQPRLPSHHANSNMLNEYVSGDKIRYVSNRSVSSRPVVSPSVNHGKHSMV